MSVKKSLAIIYLIALIVNAVDDCNENEDSECAAPIVTNKALSTTTIALNDGTHIPVVGLGTWTAPRTIRTRKYWDSKKELYSSDKLSDISQQSETDSKVEQKEEQQFKDAVIDAVKAGYRHIDSAVVYRTEKVIGEALQELYDANIVKREDMWITTKVPRDYRDINVVRNGIEESLKLLQTDYIDLYLIHSPHTDVEEAGKKGSDVLAIYKLLLEYQKEGKIKSVGVSNFGIEHLRSIERNGLPLPSVNQIEVSVFLVEHKLIQYCKEKGIVIEAYSPIAQAQDIATSDPVLKGVAEKYAKELKKELTFAHVMIRWCIDKGFVVLPKSVNKKRIIANGDVFDFKIQDADMKRLDELKSAQYRICWNPLGIEWDV